MVVVIHKISGTQFLDYEERKATVLNIAYPCVLKNLQTKRNLNCRTNGLCPYY